jgi:hypothetical protein
MAESDMNKFSWQKRACVHSAHRLRRKIREMKSPVRIFLGGKGFQTGPGEEIAQIDAQKRQVNHII